MPEDMYQALAQQGQINPDTADVLRRMYGRREESIGALREGQPPVSPTMPPEAALDMLRARREQEASQLRHEMRAIEESGDYKIEQTLTGKTPGFVLTDREGRRFLLPKYGPSHGEMIEFENPRDLAEVTKFAEGPDEGGERQALRSALASGRGEGYGEHGYLVPQIPPREAARQVSEAQISPEAVMDALEGYDPSYKHGVLSRISETRATPSMPVAAAPEKKEEEGT